MHSCILLFSLLPEEEVLRKKLSGNKEHDLALFDCLFSHVERAAIATKLPIIYHTQNQQKGSNFAEKITHALSVAFTEQYDNVIVIAGDTPNLHSKQILFTAQQLQQGKKLVTGQDKRGGVYLLGVHKSAFEPNIFLQFSWQTRQLFSQLKLYSPQADFVCIPYFLKDINTIHDVEAFYKSHGLSKKIKLSLQALIVFVKLSSFTTVCKALINFRYTNTILRGPPRLYSYQ